MARSRRKRKNLLLLDFLGWLLFAASGKIIIYLWQTFPMPPVAERTKKKYLYKLVDKLHSCDLCSGVWVYFALAAFLEADIVSPYFGVPATIAGEFVTAGITSYLVHVFSYGWRAKHEVIEI